MKFDEVWKRIKINKPFYIGMINRNGYRIDFDRSVICYNDNVWDADPVQAIQDSFRRINSETGKSHKDEYGAILEYFNKNGVAVPFSRKEYTEYNIMVSRSNMISMAVDSVSCKDDGTFIIPEYNKSASLFGSSHEFISDKAKDLFLCSGEKARLAFNIYGLISGFEIFHESGIINISTEKDEMVSSCFFLSGIKTLNSGDTIKVIPSHAGVPSSNNIVMVSDIEGSGLSVIARYFSIFDIDNIDDIRWATDVAKELYIANPSATIMIAGRYLPEFVSDYLSVKVGSHSANYGEFDYIASNYSHYPEYDKNRILSLLSDSKSEYISRFLSMIMSTPDRVSPKIRDLVVRTNIEFIAKNPANGSFSGSVIIYNKSGGYYKDVSIGSPYVSRDIIPEIGGTNYVERFCNLSNSNVPKGYNSVKAFIDGSISTIVHEEYSSLPVYRGKLGIGANVIDGEPIFNGGKSIYGTGNGRSISGCLLDVFDQDISFPVMKPSKRVVVEKIEGMVDIASKFFHPNSDDGVLLSILILSSSVSRIFGEEVNPVVKIRSQNNYTLNGFVEEVMTDIFPVSLKVNSPLKKDVEDFLSHHSVPVAVYFNKSISSSIKSELNRRRTLRTVNTNNISAPLNLSPIFILSNDDISFKGDVVFDFKLDDCGVKAGYVESIHKDIMPFLMKSYSTMLKIMKSIESIKEEHLNIMSSSLSYEYVEFFKKISVAMAFCEHTGYMTARDFHDKMFKKHFYGKNVDSSVDARSLIMGLSFGDSNKTIRDIISSNCDGVQVDEVYVAKAAHYVSMANNKTPKKYIVIFSINKMYDRVKGVSPISMAEFRKDILGSRWHISVPRNYRVGPDFKRNPLKIYNSIWGDDDSDYGTIRVDPKDL